MTERTAKKLLFIDRCRLDSFRWKTAEAAAAGIRVVAASKKQ